MIDIFALIAVLFIGLGLGAVGLAIIFYVIDHMQNGDRR
jgi:Flp pilus assembly protein TadG